MKQSVNFHGFVQAFKEAGRMGNFSYDGLEMLFEYFEAYEEDCGIEIELDVIAICCDFNEDNFLDVAANYDIDLSWCDDDEDIRQAVIEYLEDNTIVVGHNDDVVIYQIF